MESIPAPVPGYVPRLPERTVSERLLSASQLETVVYAGHAWSQMLQGHFRPDEEGAGLTISEDGDSCRKGFFLVDDTLLRTDPLSHATSHLIHHRSRPMGVTPCRSSASCALPTRTFQPVSCATTNRERLRYKSAHAR